MSLANSSRQYFAAMVAHDPKKAPIAPNAKFTEQAEVRNRKICEIEATGAVLPFNSKNGWSDFLR